MPRLRGAKIKKPDCAVKALKRRLVARELDGEIRVLKADFCYFEMGQSAEQRFFEPTYAFVFETTTENFPYKSVEVIPAIDNPRENWNPK